jgi:hypothetical protein
MIIKAAETTNNAFDEIIGRAGQRKPRDGK